MAAKGPVFVFQVPGPFRVREKLAVGSWVSHEEGLEVMHVSSGQTLRAGRLDQDHYHSRRLSSFLLGRSP